MAHDLNVEKSIASQLHNPNAYEPRCVYLTLQSPLEAHSSFAKPYKIGAQAHITPKRGLRKQVNKLAQAFYIVPSNRSS